jgi:hypothetical protein
VGIIFRHVSGLNGVLTISDQVSITRIGQDWKIFQGVKLRMDIVKRTRARSVRSGVMFATAEIGLALARLFANTSCSPKYPRRIGSRVCVAIFRSIKAAVFTFRVIQFLPGNFTLLLCTMRRRPSFSMNFTRSLMDQCEYVEGMPVNPLSVPS